MALDPLNSSNLDQLLLKGLITLDNASRSITAPPLTHQIDISCRFAINNQHSTVR